MILRRAAFLALPLLLAACAGGPAPADGGNGRMADAVEPSLRAAAASAEAARDYKGAAQHWGTLYNRHPDNPEFAVGLARTLRYAGQPQQGADIMQAQLEGKPDDADLLTELGKDYLAADRLPLAQSALERKPDDPDVLTELGKDYLAADRLPLALSALDRARAAAPRRWDVYSALGVTLDAQGHFPEAAQAYAQALALSPDNPRVLNNLALSQALSGHLDEAVATMTRAADHPRATAQIRQNLALLLAIKGDPAKAEKLVRQDLPADMARNNAAILRALAAQRD